MSGSRAPRRLVVLLLGLLLSTAALTACGKAEDPDAALRKTLAGGVYVDMSEPDQPPVVTEREADCIAGEMMKRFDLKRLQSLKIVGGTQNTWGRLPRTFPEESRLPWVDSLGACVDLRAFTFGMWRVGAGFKFGEGLTAEDAKWRKAEDCVVGGMTEAEARAIVIALYGGKAGDESHAEAVIDNCAQTGSATGHL